QQRRANPELKRQIRIYPADPPATMTAVRKRLSRGGAASAATPAAPPLPGSNWKVFGVAGLTFGGLCLATLFGVLLAREWSPVALSSQAPSVILATQLP